MSRYPAILGLGTQQPSSTTASSTLSQTLAQQAAQQVNALLEQFPNCRALRQDRSVFELPIRLPDGRTTALTITLLQQFPHERPLLTVPQTIVHPWVGYSGQLDFPSLRAWQYPNSTLVKVVQDAFLGLGGRPTTPPPTCSQNRPSQTQNANASTSGSTHSQSHSHHSQGAPGALGPRMSTGGPAPDWGAFLSDVPAEELAEASHSVDAFESLFQKLLQRAGDKPNEALKAAQAKLVEQAQRNLQKEVALNDVRNQIKVIRSTDCAGGIADFNARRERVTKAIAPVSPDALLEGLQTAAVSVDSESEQLVRKFMHGQLPVDEFVGRYGDLRALYHKRDLKRQAAMQTMSLRR